MWQAQYPEPLEGVAGRGVAAGRRFLSVWQAQYPEPLEGVGHAVSPLGALSVWQAQYPRASRKLRRVVSPLGPGFCLCGRRSIPSL